jgi:hypothetical protein
MGKSMKIISCSLLMKLRMLTDLEKEFIFLLDGVYLIMKVVCFKRF